jgi:dienelactone hydrolase
MASNAASRRSVVRRVQRAIVRVPGAGVALAPSRTAAFAVNAFLRGGVGPTGPGIPRARMSAAIAAQVALDEALLGVMRSPRRFPSAKDWERIGGDLAATLDFYGRRGWLANPPAYHRAPPSLESPSIRRASVWGVKYERLSWPSEFEPHDGEPRADDWRAYERNATAHAYVVRSGEHRPWLICLHGFGVGYASADFVAFRAAHLAHDLGLNLIFPVMPLHGPRRAGAFGGAELLSNELHRFVIGMSHAMWDIRRIIGWARAQNPRVGVYGMSLGGYAAALLSTLEPGLETVIAGVPVTDLPSLLRKHVPRRVVQRGEEHGVTLESLREAFSVVSPLVSPPKLAPNDLYVFAALGDRLAPPAQARLLQDAWRTQNFHWSAGAHLSFLWDASVNAFIDDALRARLSPGRVGGGSRPKRLRPVAFS